MPDFPILDTHVHLWDPSYLRIAWLDNNALLGKRFSVAEYREHTAGINIGAMVYVEVAMAPHYTLLEPKWVLSQAEEDPRIQGIVAYAPLEYGEQVRTYLSALRAISPLVKGVRRIVQSEPDERFCLTPRFLAGVKMLPEFGLSCDVTVNNRQLASAVEMVRQCPNTSFILDHIGNPNVKGRVMDPWRENIKQLAALPNVICKVSGMVSGADPKNWTAEDLKPYLEHVLTSFGEGRVAFGGDWPVVLKASSYERWYKTLDELTAHLSPAAKRKLWYENGHRFYRLTENKK